MFISYVQLAKSLKRLEDIHPFMGIGFLALKDASAPVGKTREIKISRYTDRVLKRYYRASGSFDGYYQPFKSSRPSERWVSRRYGSTSMQRVMADTFGAAFLHKKNTSAWGWRGNYVTVLSELLRATDTRPVPLFDLACWMYRGVNLGPAPTPTSLITRLGSVRRIASSAHVRLRFLF
jgi:hypothetical protein